MKSSRFRGAALASLAFIASGTVQAQSPYPPAPARYPSAQQFAPAPNGYRVAQMAPNSGPAFAPPMNTAYPARPVAYGATNLIPEPSLSVLSNPGPTAAPARPSACTGQRPSRRAGTP